MRRVLKRLLFVLLVVVASFAVLVGVLAATSARPRDAAQWRRLADLPDPRGEVAAAVVRAPLPCSDDVECAFEELLVVAGGIRGAGRTTARVDLYDTQDETWKRGPDLPEPRHHAAAAAIGQSIYVTGGGAAATNWNPLRTMWVLEEGARTWSDGPPLPEGRLGHQMVTLDGRLYVVGGRGETSNVLIFDPQDRRWSRGAEMPFARDHLVAVADRARILAIGGRDESLHSRVDVYDVAEDAWSPGPPLPVPMSAMAGGALPDGIHVVGGENPKTLGGGIIDRHFVLRRGGDDWAEAPLPVVATHGSAGGVLGDRLVVAGGARRQGALSPLGWTGVVQAFTPE